MPPRDGVVALDYLNSSGTLMQGNTSHRIAALIAAMAFGSALAEGPRERHAHHFAKDVDTFHAVLAPLWHARPGAERAQGVCAQQPRLAQLASAIQSGNAKPLLSALAALKTQCQTDPSAIDGAFAQVHDAFHHLAEPGRNPLGQ